MQPIYWNCARAGNVAASAGDRSQALKRSSKEHESEHDHTLPMVPDFAILTVAGFLVVVVLMNLLI